MATAPKIKHEQFPVREISLKALVIDDALQSRVKHNVEHEMYFAGLYAAGRPVSPPTVFEDPDTGVMILADGFHRSRAAIAHGLKSMPCEIRPGTRDDAYVFSAGANQEMSLKRTREDIRKACHMLFDLPGWWNKSDSLIAVHVGTTRATVQKWRLEFADRHEMNVPQKTEWKDGVMRSVKQPGAIRKSGRFYRATINGKAFKLLITPDGYEQILRMVEDEKSRMRDKRNSLDPACVIARLRSDGISPIPVPFIHGVCAGRPGLYVFRETIFAILEPKGKNTLPHEVGLLFLFSGPGQKIKNKIIVSYIEDLSREAVNLAVSIGIKFFRPDEISQFLIDQSR